MLLSTRVLLVTFDEGQSSGHFLLILVVLIAKEVEQRSLLDQDSGLEEFPRRSRVRQQTQRVH
jgi:hypothetical protein